MQTKKYYYLITAILLIYSSLSVISQEKKTDKKETKQENKLRDRFVFGGNVGLAVGTYTYIDVSPIAGFYVTPKYLAGAGLTYNYYNETADKSIVRISSHIFGFRIFNSYTIIDNIGKNLRMKQNFGVFGHTEYEALNLDRDFSNSQQIGRIQRFWLHGFLLGGGIRQGFGKNASFNVAILYNFFADTRTPYTNPVIRIGFYL